MILEAAITLAGVVPGVVVMVRAHLERMRQLAVLEHRVDELLGLAGEPGEEIRRLRTTLARTPFAQMTPEQMRQAAKLMAEASIERYSVRDRAAGFAGIATRPIVRHDPEPIVVESLGPPHEPPKSGTPYR